MNPLLGGITLGKCLAEGDYLGAIPFFPDIVKAVRSAAPGLLREKAVQGLTSLQNRLGPSAPAPIASAPPTPAPSVNWIIPAVVTVGGFFLIRRVLKKRSR